MSRNRLIHHGESKAVASHLPYCIKSAVWAKTPLIVDWHKKDRYSRIVGKLLLDGEDVNLNMVRSGFAWWYRKYANEQSPADQDRYEAAEFDARAGRVGLWVDPSPMAPWDWRDRPEPPGGYAAHFPCGSGEICTGKRGGRFCVRSSGTKKYLPRGE